MSGAIASSPRWLQVRCHRLKPEVAPSPVPLTQARGGSMSGAIDSSPRWLQVRRHRLKPETVWQVLLQTRADMLQPNPRPGGVEGCTSTHKS
jgi:hypothetical protein